MFFRFTGHQRHAEHLDGIFRGSVFLLGGGKQLKHAADWLAKSGVMTCAMNNAGTVVRPKIWVGADGAEYYSASILHDPSVMKFMRIIRMDTITQEGEPVRTCPNMHFYKEDPDMVYERVFTPRDTIIFWKNVFTMSLQILWKLGFSRVYCVGCGFNASTGYAFKSNHVGEYEKYNQNTYDGVIRQLKKLLPYAKAAGLEVVSCDDKSKLHDVGVPFRGITEAIEDAQVEIPKTDTVNVLHPKDVLDKKDDA